METKLPENAPDDEPEPSQKIATALERYVSKLQGIKQAMEIVMPLISEETDRASETFKNFVSKSGVQEAVGEKKTTYTIPMRKVATFELLDRKRDNLNAAYHQTPKAFLVAMVSCYDAFLGDLLKAVFYLKPEMLNASQRSLTFEELVKLGDIQNAREYLVEKEVESVIRESHNKQFDWMEKRLDIVLRKDLQAWPIFLEMTERRNLFVHTDGVVSRQYVEVCRANKVDITEIAIGDRLNVSAKYFTLAFICLFEIGVKLSQVLWRKFAPSDLEKADDALIDTTFNLLKEQQYRLAACLSKFASQTIKKHHSNVTKRVFIINLAIAYKWGGVPEKVEKLITDQDWSDCSDNFKLAVAVLTDRFDDAEKVMRELGANAKGVTRVGYETWPLFNEFRKTDQFQNAFRAIYGEAFVIEVEPKDDEGVSEKLVVTELSGDNQSARDEARRSSSSFNESTAVNPSP
ncbi:MAG: hypothetical protein ABIT76_13530 [Chthoniobacterales bacterium]